MIHRRLLSLAAASTILCAANAAAQKQVEFDFAPFTPFSVAGEFWLVSSVQGEVIDTQIDATLVVNETGPWSMNISFDWPNGFDGFSSEVEGWSGAGTFSTSFNTDAFNGLVTVPEGSAFYSAFLYWTGGTPFSLPGGGSGVGPLDGVFTELKVTLTFADCPFGDPDAPWTDLGGALAGSTGTPALAGSGSLCAAEQGVVTLTGAAPGASALLVVGTSGASLPLLGGTLVPSPDLILPPTIVDGAGGATEAFVWPAGLPPGAELWVQYWIVDPLAPTGFAASNGLRATAP